MASATSGIDCQLIMKAFERGANMSPSAPAAFSVLTREVQAQKQEILFIMYT